MTTPTPDRCREEVFAELGLAPTRSSASGSIASTTRRASKSACWRWSGCSSASPSIGTLHVRPAGRAKPVVDPAVPGPAGSRGRPGRAHQHAFRHEHVPADHPETRASRAAARVPLPQGCGPVLRQQPARRHEPGREGVRRRAGRRAGRAGSELVHGRSEGSARIADRESVRFRRGQRRAGGGARDASGRAADANDGDAPLRRRVQRLPLGVAHAARCRASAPTRADRGPLRDPARSTWRGV